MYIYKEVKNKMIFKNFFRDKNLSKDRKNKNGALTSTIVNRTGNSGSLSKRDLIKKYENNPILHLCISKIAESCGASKLKLYKKSAKGNTLIFNHDLIKLMEQPNPLMTQREFISVLIGSQELHGTAYIYVEKSKNKPIFLWALSPNEILQKPTHNNGYKYNINIDGNKLFVGYEDMIALKNWNYSNIYDSGVSTTHSLTNTLMASDSISQYLRTFFNNNATPSMLIGVDDTDSDELFELKENFESENVGLFNKFKTTFLNKKFSVHQLSQNLEDLGISQLQEMHNNEIRKAFSIPESLIGGNSANRASAMIDRETFISEVIMPKISSLLDILNVQLVQRYYAKDLFFESDIESPTTRELIVKLMSTCSDAFTLNEVRELVGYEQKADLENKRIDMTQEQGVNSGYGANEQYNISDRAEKTNDSTE